jgi:hypothetical protein
VERGPEGRVERGPEGRVERGPEGRVQGMILEHEAEEAALLARHRDDERRDERNKRKVEEERRRAEERIEAEQKTRAGAEDGRRQELTELRRRQEERLRAALLLEPGAPAAPCGPAAPECPVAGEPGILGCSLYPGGAVVRVYPQQLKHRAPPPHSSSVVQVCLERMAPPTHIFQCGSGHKVCGACRPLLQVPGQTQPPGHQECPSRCGHPLQGRDFGTEQFLRSLRPVRKAVHFSL